MELNDLQENSNQMSPSVNSTPALQTKLSSGLHNIFRHGLTLIEQWIKIEMAYHRPQKVTKMRCFSQLFKKVFAIKHCVRRPNQSKPFEQLNRPPETPPARSWPSWQWWHTLPYSTPWPWSRTRVGGGLFPHRCLPQTRKPWGWRATCHPTWSPQFFLSQLHLDLCTVHSEPSIGIGVAGHPQSPISKMPKNMLCWFYAVQLHQKQASLGCSQFTTSEVPRSP